MIKINLLPLELRKEKNKVIYVPYIPLAILAVVLFLLMTLFFYGDYLRARSAHTSIKKEWDKLSPALAQLKALETKVEGEMKEEKVFLENNILNTESMTMMLYWVSEFLPPKGWLTEFKAVREGGGCRFTLAGVVLASRTQTGIEQVEEYLRKLRAKLPPQTLAGLTTSKGGKENASGTAFVVQLDWGETSRP